MRILVLFSCLALACNIGRRVPVDETAFKMAVHELERERTRLLQVQLELGTTKSDKYQAILNHTVQKLKRSFAKMPVSFWEELFLRWEDPTNTLHDVLIRQYLYERVTEFVDLTVADTALKPHYIAVCDKLTANDICRFIYADDTKHIPELIKPTLYKPDDLRLWFPGRRQAVMKKVFINGQNVTEVFYNNDPSREDDDNEELERPPMQYWKSGGTVYTLIFLRRGERLTYKLSWYLKEKS